MADPKQEGWKISFEYTGSRPYHSREDLEAKLRWLGGHNIQFEPIQLDPLDDTFGIAGEIEHPYWTDEEQISEFLYERTRNITTKVFNAGWLMARDSPEQSPLRNDYLGKIDLRKVLKSMREFESGNDTLVNIGRITWDYWAWIIAVRLADDPETEDSLVLPWDKNKHGKLRYYTHEVSRRDAVKRIQQAYEEHRSQSL